MQSLSHWPSFPAGMQGKAGGDQLRSADIVLPCIALLPAPRRENITQTLNPTNLKDRLPWRSFENVVVVYEYMNHISYANIYYLWMYIHGPGIRGTLPATLPVPRAYSNPTVSSTNGANIHKQSNSKSRVIPKEQVEKSCRSPKSESSKYYILALHEFDWICIFIFCLFSLVQTL